MQEEIRMHSWTVDSDICLDEEKVAIADPVTRVEVEVIGSRAMFALSFST